MATDTSTTPLAEALLAHAKSLANMGFRVFPLEMNGNRPAHEGWQKQASADLENVEKLWRDPFGQAVPYNIGVATGQGLTVLDVDVKRGQPGLDSLDELVTFLGLDDNTMTVRTRSGGLHLYYASEGFSLRNSASKIRPALDIRSEGGYVVGPGSTIDGAGYETLRDAAPKRIAPWFAELCGTKSQKAETTAPVVDLDTSEAVERATAWLRFNAPEATADSGTGDHTLYKVACGVKDFGISEGECLSLVLEHYDGEKCHPPQGQEIWETKVSNAYRHGLNPPGVRHPLADFEVVELDDKAAESPKPQRERHVFVKGHQSKHLVATFTDDFLVDDLLERHAVSCLYGPSNVGKTFVMLDLALHVASGRPWNGHETKKGAVVYVAAEGTRGIHKRIACWEKHHGLGLEDVWFSSRPSPIDLLSDNGDTASFIQAVLQEAASWGDGVKPSLIVIDTLSRALAGGDENSSVDMGAFVKHIDRIKTATEAHIAIVHHSGKDAAKGMRGWSGMRAAIDTEMEVAEGVLATTKQRDGEKMEDLGFALSDVVLGADKRGKPIKSAVAVYGAAAEMLEQDGLALTPREQDWFDLIAAGVGEMAHEKDVPATQFYFNEKIARELMLRDGRFANHLDTALTSFDNGVSRTTVLMRLSMLCKKGLLKKVKRNQWVIV